MLEQIAATFLWGTAGGLMGLMLGMTLVLHEMQKILNERYER